MSIASLVRPDIRNLRGYQATGVKTGSVLLHANEAPLAAGTGSAAGLNRYPPSRPAELTRKMAAYYAVATDNVLATRGSSEGIDLLLRTFCAAGVDNILVTPPTFDMYGVYAAIQGAKVIEVPLQANNNFALDSDAVLAACDAHTKLVFLCSPNNPSGSSVTREQVLTILGERHNRSMVVVDEAYVEFSARMSLAPLVSRFDNLVVLRTLSKAHGLAGARCGAVIASRNLIGLLSRVLAPYALSSPVVESAERALSPMRLAEGRKLVGAVVAERERLRRELADCPAVARVWPSEANFLLVQFKDLSAIRHAFEQQHIAVRSYGDNPPLRNCVRITVALASDNNRLLEAIRRVN